MFAGKLVKVSRYMESFWLRDVREIEPGIWVGTVDNKLMPSNIFRFGDKLPFAPQEVIDVCEYPAPKLSLVTH